MNTVPIWTFSWICRKESHRTRTMFRKVDAFIYVISAIVSTGGCEGCISEAEAEASPSQPRSRHGAVCPSMKSSAT